MDKGLCLMPWKKAGRTITSLLFADAIDALGEGQQELEALV